MQECLKDIQEQVKINLLVDCIGEHMGVKHFPEAFEEVITPETSFSSLKKKSLKMKKLRKAALLGINSQEWSVHHTVCPFNGYLPLPVTELNPDSRNALKTAAKMSLIIY